MTLIDKLFIFIPLTWFSAGFILWKVMDIRDRLRRKKAAQQRLRILKAREEYELATARFRDPHYYGD